MGDCRLRRRHVGRVDGGAVGLDVGGGPRARVPGEMAGDAPEGGGDGHVAERGTVKASGSDQTSLPAAMVTEAAPEKARALSVEVSMVLSTSGRGRAERDVSRVDVDGSVAGQVRELDADLAAAQRDVRDLPDDAVRERDGGRVARVGIGRPVQVPTQWFCRCRRRAAGAGPGAAGSVAAGARRPARRRWCRRCRPCRRPRRRSRCPPFHLGRGAAGAVSARAGRSAGCAAAAVRLAGDAAGRLVAARAGRSAGRAAAGRSAVAGGAARVPPPVPVLPPEDDDPPVPPVPPVCPSRRCTPLAQAPRGARGPPART